MVFQFGHKPQCILDYVDLSLSIWASAQGCLQEEFLKAQRRSIFVYYSQFRLEDHKQIHLSRR